MLLLAVILLLAAVLYPYVSALILKLNMLRRLRRVWEREGYRCRNLVRLAVLRGNRSDRYEFLIENRKQIFLVKLWSSRLRGNTLLVLPGGRMCEQRDRVSPLRVSEKGERRHRPYRTLRRRIPEVGAPRLKPNGRTVTPILLVYPSYREILVTEKGKTVGRSSGDILFGKTLCSPSYFERLLVKRSARERDGDSASNARRNDSAQGGKKSGSAQKDGN